MAITENLRKEFTKNKSQQRCCSPGQKAEIKTAVRNVSFAVDDGEVFGLLGPNGAGKSTVLNMMVAETGPTRGRVSQPIRLFSPAAGLVYIYIFITTEISSVP